MHEYTISSSIVKTVLTSAEENQAHQVMAINLEIGALVFLNPEQVEFWLKELFKETIAEEAKIRIKNIKPKIRCLDCDYEGEMKVDDNSLYHIMTPFFSCPQCSSQQIRVEKGKECLIKNIEIIK